MTEVERIEDQLTRALEGNAWHGASLKELLEDVDAKMAASRPVKDAHTIGEIVLHIAAWMCIVHDRASGKGPVTLTTEQDWPPYNGKTDQEWKDALQSLERSGKGLRQAILKLGDARLGEVPKGGVNTLYVQLHGAVQHTLYHGGQIAILKKALAGRA